MAHSFPGSSTVNGGFQYPSSGPNNAIEYMASGLPYVTTSLASTTPFKVEFPYVTSEIYIQVSGTAGSSIRVGFTQNGVQGSNFYVLDTTTPKTFRIRCKELYIRSNTGTPPSYSVMAGMTMIANKNFPVLTGSAADPTTGRVIFQSSSQDFTFGYKGLDSFP